MNQTVRLTMSQALVRFLDQQYISMDGRESKFVKGIFGIFGHGNVTGLGEALEFEDHQLSFIRGNNEQGMVHAATAFAKQKDRLQIYAVTSSIGPGATNMVTGAATASINRLPVLLLPGDVFACRQPDPVLQQLENPHSHQTTVNDCFKPVSKYWDRIDRPEQLMEAALKAFRVLTHPATTGAVTLCLPQDVQSESYDYPMDFFKRRVHVINRYQAPELQIEEALEVLCSSKKPLLIAGGGVHYSKAAKTLGWFADQFKIPVAETQAGKGCLLASHPMNMGGVGVIGSAASNQLAKDADCILAVGTRLGDFVTASKAGFLHPDLKIISLNIDLFDSGKGDPAVELLGDAKCHLEALGDGLSRSRFLTTLSYQEKIASLRQDWSAEVARVTEAQDPNNGIFQQTQVLGALNRLASENGVVVCAAGSLPGDLQRLWQCKSPKSYHLEYGYSCMGYEVAGGLGVKLAEEQREVWVVVGDGSFLMMHSELVTSLQEDKKINILLFDSGGFNCIKGLQCAHGSRGFGTDLRYRNKQSGHLDGEPIEIDYALYGRALGLKTWSVKNFRELQSAIQQAQKNHHSTLIEVKVAVGSQSEGYDSWWRVGVSDVSRQADVVSAHQVMKEQVKSARPY